MEKLCKEYRATAWAALHGNWLMAGLVAIVYGIILGIATCTLIGGLLLGGALLAGYTIYFMNLTRGKKAEIGDLFSGFSNFGGTLVAYILQMVFLTLWLCLFIVPGIIKYFSYSMTFYILNDHPNMSGNDAITLSRKMMAGHKGKLFLLNLSFIGWFLLIGVTFGIAAFWVIPYLQATTAAFYDELKGSAAPATPILEDNTIQVNNNK